MHNAALTSGPLDVAQYEEFWQRGFLVVEGVFAPSAADAISELAVSIGEEEVARAEQADARVDTSPDGRRAP